MKSNVSAWIVRDYLAHVDEHGHINRCFNKSPTGENKLNRIKAIDRTNSCKKPIMEFLPGCHQTTILRVDNLTVTDY